jgi:orotidine-5'-phosphate decarboxylase
MGETGRPNMTSYFVDELKAGVERRDTPCAVGIDPLWERFSPALLRELGWGVSGPASAEEGAHGLERFGALVVEAVHDLVPAVKFQMAYYEVYGSLGIRALEANAAAAREAGLLVILDGKRGDIGATSEAYARAYLSRSPLSPLQGDALTLAPYLGTDSVDPFIEVARVTGRGLFVCAKTSNPGGALVQDVAQDGRTVYERVAAYVDEAGAAVMGECGYSNVGIVVGVSAAEPARALRERFPRLLFLMPGLGAQGGDAEILRQVVDAEGFGALVPASRSVLYPHLFGHTTEDPQTAVRTACQALIAETAAALRAA